MDNRRSRRNSGADAHANEHREVANNKDAAGTIEDRITSHRLTFEDLIEVFQTWPGCGDLTREQLTQIINHLMWANFVGPQVKSRPSTLNLPPPKFLTS